MILIFTFQSFIFDEIFLQFTVFNTSTLSSGRVRRTRCQISEGADAPVAPVLTRLLLHLQEDLVIVSFVQSSFETIHIIFG